MSGIRPTPEVLDDVAAEARGMMATGLITLLWHTFGDPLGGARERLWARVVEPARPAVDGGAAGAPGLRALR